MKLETRLKNYVYHLLYVGAPYSNGEGMLVKSGNDLDKIRKLSYEPRYYGVNSRIVDSFKLRELIEQGYTVDVQRV